MQEGAISAREAAFERWRRVAGVVLAPLAFAVAYLLCAGHLTAEGQTLAAILATVVVSEWVSAKVRQAIS